MSLVENTLHTFGVKFPGPKIHWCTNNDNVNSVDNADNVFGTYMQYLCKSDESYTTPPSTNMMAVTTAVNPTSVHHLCKICATHVLIFE